MERMSGIPDEKADLDAWYGLAILFIAYTVSFIDRTILSLLVEPIKISLDVSDTQISLLHGLAFAIFYTLLGIPIARLADRHSRKYIISVGIFVWSMMTAVCGLADRFTTLFLARVGVGVGEAALSPAAYSMLADIHFFFVGPQSFLFRGDHLFGNAMISCQHLCGMGSKRFLMEFLVRNFVI